MGSGRWSTDAYEAAERYRSATGRSAFAYSDEGARTVHPQLDPRQAQMRESRLSPDTKPKPKPASSRRACRNCSSCC